MQHRCHNSSNFHKFCSALFTSFHRFLLLWFFSLLLYLWVDCWCSYLHTLHSTVNAILLLAIHSTLSNGIKFKLHYLPDKCIWSRKWIKYFARFSHFLSIGALVDISHRCLHSFDLQLRFSLPVVLFTLLHSLDHFSLCSLQSIKRVFAYWTESAFSTTNRKKNSEKCD